MDFPDLLRLIDERSAAFCAAVSSAPSLDVQVPTCPEWTLFDLVQHLGVGRRAWAATVAAGPGATGKATAEDSPTAPTERDALVAWMAASTEQLVNALREAGPDRGCWTWWGDSQSPETCGAVARHQLQEIAMHTYDAQLTAESAEPLPDEVALDGAEEFLVTCCATTLAWPHEPAVVDYHATEGRSWRQWVSADGSRIARLPEAGDAGDDDALAVDASCRGTASDLVLMFYGRVPLETLALEGDRGVFDKLIAWDFDA